MCAHWVYKTGEDVPTKELEQGDVLQKTERVSSLLRLYHPHYESHPENRFLIVLTQSCDLVKRPTCKARYISVAPVRSLKHVVRAEFEGKISNTRPGSQAYGSIRTKSNVEQFLERLFNNNQPEYFYLEKEPGAGLYENMCASLRLPISFKAEHYDTLLEARLIGIKDEFQAKLGWLLGQLYSRVGTKDFEPVAIKSKVKEATEALAVWFEETEVDAIRLKIQEHDAANPGALIKSDQLAKWAKDVPKKKAQVIVRFLDKATELGIIATPSSERKNLRLALEQDEIFAKLFK